MTGNKKEVPASSSIMHGSTLACTTLAVCQTWVQICTLFKLRNTAIHHQQHKLRLECGEYMHQQHGMPDGM